jgi:hypothetical protein
VLAAAQSNTPRNRAQPATVWFADGRESVRLYWDIVSRRLRSELLTRDQAIEKAALLARAETDKLNSSE